jgi:hypothetical protein
MGEDGHFVFKIGLALLNNFQHYSRVGNVVIVSRAAICVPTVLFKVTWVRTENHFYSAIEKKIHLCCPAKKKIVFSYCTRGIIYADLNFASD